MLPNHLIESAPASELVDSQKENIVQMVSSVLSWQEPKVVHSEDIPVGNQIPNLLC